MTTQRASLAPCTSAIAESCAVRRKLARAQWSYSLTIAWLLPLIHPNAAAAQTGAEVSVADSKSWDPAWRRTSSFDLALTGFAAAAAFTLELIPAEESATWQGPILFDSAIRNALVARTSRGRNNAYVMSDLALWTSVSYVVLDATVGSMLVKRDVYTGYEMLMMDAEAFAITALLNTVTKRLTARERPDTDECQKSPDYDGHCSGREKNMSFYSGHAAGSATSAGLICAHHQRLALYGGAWDGAACGASIVLTSLTGALRVVSDRHWATDVLVGHLVGFTTGYFVPQLFHYRAKRDEDLAVGVRGMMPMAGPTGTSITVFGVF
ncbi:MAG TPA: phosphatase PAP2 family protein [Polyangiaceae bacterium]